MRLMDKWFGVPLCFVMSCLSAGGRLRRKQQSRRPLHKILFIQLSEMGSAVSAYSALRKARQLFPHAELYYLIFEEMQESIRLLTVIPEENILAVSSRTLSAFVADSLKVIRSVRTMKIDAVVDLELFSRTSILFSYLFGAPIRAGFYRFHLEGLYRGSLQTHRVIYNHLNHISVNFLSLVYALQEKGGREPLTKVPVNKGDIIIPKLSPSPEDKQRTMRRLQRLCPDVSAERQIVLLNPNGSTLLPLRRWPMDRYIELARRLLANPAVYVVVTGTASERTDAAYLCDAVQSNRCINFAGHTSMRELIDLYAIATLMVSNDSGPPNFASLTDLPVLVFFGPETPQCYRPLGERVEVLYADYFCSPCVSAYNHRKSACTDNRCLQAITVEEVCRRLNGLVSGLVP